MRKFVVLVIAVLGLGGAVAGVAVADPNLNLTTVPHHHYINGVEVGPRICEDPTNPALLGAFTQFHANVHSHGGVTGEIGPTQPAPGLHNGKGADITSVSPC